MTAPQDPTDLPAVAAQLIKTIDELTKSIQELLHRTARSEKQTKWQWVVIGAISILFAVQGFTTYQQVQTSARLDDTRSGVLCPLFSVFLGSYNPTTRAAGADRETYEATFAVIRGGYRDLACTTPFVPPPTTRVTPPK